MLFNSFLFLFGFLPIVLAIMFLLAARKPSLVPGWLAIASLVFYAGWSFVYLPLLVGSIASNYAVGRRISRFVANHNVAAARTWMWFGVACNLLILGYYKYAGFIGEIVHDSTGIELNLANIVLPIGISFFTFTQIAYLVDARRGLTREYEPVRYGLFVSYFPHLVAGPILHHREMIEQFAKRDAFRFNSQDLAAGLTLFAIGLAKKVLLADSIGPVANAVFNVANAPGLTMGEAWVGTLAYSMQIYFDFSGYSDMALGIGMMMGIRLPLNFNSPYKATSIIDFWRRWHMTLSRFLKDYLYIPLGGNRHGWQRHSLNVMITMLLGGLWHGASWTFVIWGGLHGIYLMIDHAWRALRFEASGRAVHLAGWLLTFLAVNVAWVFFRADSVGSAFNILLAMFGANGVVVPTSIAAAVHALTGLTFAAGSTFPNALFDVSSTLPMLALLTVIALLLPNSQTVVARFRPALDPVAASAGALSWIPSRAWAIAVGALIAVCVTRLGGDSPFLYFRF